MEVKGREAQGRRREVGTEGRVEQRDGPMDKKQSIDSLAIDPSKPQIIYAGTYHLPWKTLDGGRT